MKILRWLFGDTGATTMAPLQVGASARLQPDSETLAGAPPLLSSPATAALVWPTPEEQEERRHKMAAEAARWSSRAGYEYAFMDKDEIDCRAERAVWASALLFNGGWPNHNPGDRPVRQWVCCLCGWTTEQRVASDFLQMPGRVIGMGDAPGSLENAGMMAYLQRVEHLLTHDLKPDPVNSPLQRAERMCLDACNHTCYVQPTPAQFMGC